MKMIICCSANVLRAQVVNSGQIKQHVPPCGPNRSKNHAQLAQPSVQVL